MSSLTISLVIFACILASGVVGLRSVLPEKHLTPETKDLVKLAMGLVGTMAALVLGLLIGSAKSSFDAQRGGLAQMSGNIVFLDRALAHYGPDAKEAREALRTMVSDMIQRMWPDEHSESSGMSAALPTEGRYEAIFDKIEALAPKNESQRAAKTQAIKTAIDITQTRWLLFAQSGRSIPTPFLVVLVFWLMLILASYSMFAPPNVTTFVTLLLCALAVSSAVFLILELDRPFDGVLRLSSAPLRNALAQLGK